MRLWRFCAFAALATVSAAALGQLAYQKMQVLTPRQIFDIRPIIVLPQPPPQPQAPKIGFRGCAYYQDANWQGKWRSITGGTRRLDVGKSWNDLISSFSCSPSCRVVAFADDFKGQRAEFGTTAYVGDAWNDKISSMIAVCQHPF
jgi:hypothetical protein